MYSKHPYEKRTLPTPYLNLVIFACDQILMGEDFTAYQGREWERG